MDIAGEITGALGLNGFGEVVRLEIQSWADIKRKGTSENTYSSFINPDEYTLNYNVIADPTSAVGSIATTGNFLGTPPMEVNLKFVLDGTNAIGKQLKVADDIQHFNEVVGYDGNSHRTRFLRLIWGKGAWMRKNQFAFDCILKSASIQYKLFNTDGTPLRAIISATFTEALSYTQQEAETQKKSADLTHKRVVKEGDTLPGITQEVYGDFSLYLKVAQFNHLTDFRDLQPGQQIFFPPLDKTVTKSNA